MDLVPSNYSRSGVRRSGDDYQDIVALDVLVEMLENPQLYDWVKVEADDAGTLDDLLALRRDGSVDARQVKFSVHPNEAHDPYSWEKLLLEPISAKGNKSASLLAKWAGAFRALASAHANVDARVVSNRRAAPDLQEALSVDGRADVDRISDDTTRAEIYRKLGSEEEAREFFQSFRFDLGAPGLGALEEGVLRRFRRLGGDIHGWRSLKDELRGWVRQRHSPSPGGAIVLMDVKVAALWQELESLPQEFVVPTDFVIPSEVFHDEFMDSVDRLRSGCIVLYASAGGGKSTYLSNIYRQLHNARIPTVRHHFFLSSRDTTPLRYDHTQVAHSLMADLRRELPELESSFPTTNPKAEELSGWLSTIGRHLSAEGRKVVVILDGLDHVWREVESVRELDQLFDLLGPAREGVLMLVGTQPVDRSQLPKRLLELAPRQNWHELPRLDFAAIRAWTEFHAQDLGVPEEGTGRSHRLEELTVALWNKSEGHPLYLRYLVRQLAGQGSFVTARDITNLPEIPHREIERYYDRLWEALPSDSKQVLLLLALCDFPWPRTALAECLDPNRHNLLIDNAISRITHLTEEEPAGLRLSHNSIQVFIRSRREYHDYGGRVRALALAWIRTRAPEFLRWAFEWLLEADGGAVEGLLCGPNRAWLIEGMAKAYPSSYADRVLTRSAQVALEQGNLARFVELALLSDYLSFAINFRDGILDDLILAQVAIGEDELLLKRMRGQIRFLSPAEVIALAERFFNCGQTDVVFECFQRLNEDLRTNRRMRPSRAERPKTAEHMLRVAVLTRRVSSTRIVNWLIRQRRPTVKRAGAARAHRWELYVQLLRTFSRVESFRDVIARIRRWPSEARRSAIGQFTLLACEEGFDPKGALPPSDGDDPLIIIRDFINDEHVGRAEAVKAPDPWVLGLREFELFEHYSDIEEFFWRLFFVLVANHLHKKDTACAEIVGSLAKYGWATVFIERCESAARSLAAHFESRIPVAYGWMFEQFLDITGPERNADRMGHGLAIGARRMLLRASFDLLSLQTSLRRPSIEKRDVEAAQSAGLFQLQMWVEYAISVRRAWLSSEALNHVLSAVRIELGKNVDYFDSRAEACTLAARLAAQHGASDIAACWVREAWSNLLSYGYHKDMLWDQCLESVGHLEAGGRGDAVASLIAMMAPAIAEVGKYTDGDETGYLPVDFGRLIAKVNFRWFVGYHEWLCRRTDYYHAESLFAEVIPDVDLGNPFLRALAETTVERLGLSRLSLRAKAGDKHAEECLRSIWPFSRDHETRSTPASSHREEASIAVGPDRKDFPPESFDQFLSVLQASGVQRVEEAVDQWAEYWRHNADNNLLLQKLDAFDRSGGDLFRNLNLRFEIALDVLGRKEAFERLLKAQTGNYGWSRYYSAPEIAQYRWRKVAELYPERWLEFLQKTLMEDTMHISRSGVTIHHKISRIVEYLLVVGQTQLAANVATAAIASAIDLVPLVMTQPSWIVQGPFE
jgi:hypothetical protein